MGALLEIIENTKPSAHVLYQLVREKAWNEYQCQFADSEIKRVVEDTTGVEECTSQQIDSWACGVVIRMIQQRGEVPNGWDKTSRCARCGVVWSDHGLDVLSCGWCHLRNEEKDFPRP